MKIFKEHKHKLHNWSLGAKSWYNKKNALCKNRWLTMFIVQMRGGMWNHRQRRRKKGGWGKMDRGEDRDLLSSGFFDGTHDRPYNKRIMANDSRRKRSRESERGRSDFHWGAFSHTGVMFARPRKQGLSVIWIPRQTTTPTKITAWNLKEKFDLCLASPPQLNLTNSNIWCYSQQVTLV